MDLRGYGRIAGTDEAGRGPLCGPVIAAAVVLTDSQEDALLSLGLTDSKALSPRKRERLFISMNELGVLWRAQSASPDLIDRTNILRASLWAMRRSVLKLPPFFDTLFVDGTTPIANLPFSQKALAGADSLVPAVAAASVVAKVLRDRVMVALDALYPEYGLKKHKGYPTKAHRAVLASLGPSSIHRKSFAWRTPS